MSHSNPKRPTLQGQEDGCLVTLEQYGLEQPSARLKLTPLDMSLPRLYGARWVLCFPLIPGTDKLQVYESLKRGLAQTIISIPWIDGKVGPEEGQDPKHRRIQVLDSPGGLVFPCKDLSEAMPSYKELKTRNFPLSEFSTAQLGPIEAMPQGPVQPVFAAQANFIQGGLLLSVGVHHSVCDASGLDAILSTWSHNTAVASGSSGSYSTFDDQSNDRAPLMEGLPATDLSNYPEYTLMPTPETADAQGLPASGMPSCSCRLLRFSPEALTNIKAIATAFSTHDALCAFLWQRITLARMRSGVLTNHSGDTAASAFCFAVNIRGRMSPPLPASYLGNASMASMTPKFALPVIASTGSLPQMAASIRKTLSNFKSPDRISSTIGLLNSRPDPTDLKLTFNAFLGPDIVETSWADLGVYGHEWGAMGMLDAFRLPDEGTDGVIMILPKPKDGGLEVVLGLRTDVMEALLQDEEFRDIAQF